MIHLRAFYASSKKTTVQFAVLLFGWMMFTSVCGLLMMGYVMDDMLRTALDAKQLELLAARHLTLGTAYRAAGEVGLETVIKNESFKNDYIRLTNRDGSTSFEINPEKIHFNRPGTPLKTISGNSEVPGWQKAITATGKV